MNSPSRNRRGFTAAEFLIAVAIIAVLVGLLLPVAGAVRRAARSAACLANLQKWGDSYRMYVNDHGGRSLSARQNPTNLAWYERLQPYNGNIHQILRCPEATRPGNAIGSDVSAWGPALAWDQMPSGQSPGRLRGTYVGSYGFNAWLYGVPPAAGPPPPGALDPGAGGAERVPVLADCVEEWGQPQDTDTPPLDLHHPLPPWGGVGPRPAGPAGSLCYFCIDRHRRVVNALFLDGHADHVPLAELWRLRWNGTFTARNVLIP